MKPAFSAFFSLLFSTVLLAQTSVHDTIVVTASAIPESAASTPAAVSIVTREDMEQRAASDVAAVLREVAGITISRTGSPGKATSLFSRGANSTHTLVLWNGLELNNPFFAGYDWGRFSTAGVEQVEVVRGPYSALYGSDAVAGVVNVLTTPKHTGVRAEGESGGNGLRNGTVGGAYVHGTLSAGGSFESRQDAGFAANDDFGQNSGDVTLHWLAGEHFTAGIAGRATSYDLGVPVNLNAAGNAIVPSLQRRQSGSERQVAVPLTQTFRSFSWEVTLAESRRSDHFDDPEDPWAMFTATTDSVTRRARITTRTATRFGTVVAGGELERARVDDWSTFGANLTNDRRDERSLFVEDRYSTALGASHLEVSAGVRRDDYREAGGQTSPRVAVAWIIGMTKFRAAYGSAFRAPAVGELFYPFSGNAALQPERSRSVEAGADWYPSFGELSLTVFRSHFRDLIVFDNATYRFANVGVADSRGVELSATRRLPLDLSAAMSYTFLDTEQDRSGQPLLRRPRSSASLTLNRRSGVVDAAVVLLYTGRRDDVLPVAPFSRVSDRGYATADITLQVHAGRVTPFVKLENAMDARYEEVRGYPSPRRRAIAGVRFTM